MRQQIKPVRYSLYQDHLIEDSPKLRRRLKLAQDLVSGYENIGKPPKHWEMKITGYIKDGLAKKTLWRGDSRTNHGRLVDCREAKGGAKSDLLNALARKFKFDGLKGTHPPMLRAQFFKTDKHRRVHASITATLTKARDWRIKAIKHATIAELKCVIDLLEDAGLLELVAAEDAEATESAEAFKSTETLESTEAQPEWFNSRIVECEPSNSTNKDPQ